MDRLQIVEYDIMLMVLKKLFYHNIYIYIYILKILKI
jgi:hypothetical protein